jgi:hypothetical protein
MIRIGDTLQSVQDGSGVVGGTVRQAKSRVRQLAEQNQTVTAVVVAGAVALGAWLIWKVL